MKLIIVMLLALAVVEIDAKDHKRDKRMAILSRISKSAKIIVNTLIESKTTRSLTSALFPGKCTLDRCITDMSEIWTTYARAAKWLFEYKKDQIIQHWEEPIRHLKILYDQLTEIFVNQTFTYEEDDEIETGIADSDDDYNNHVVEESDESDETTNGNSDATPEPEVETEKPIYYDRVGEDNKRDEANNLF